ncbi:MAG TPA: hypothetical protein VFR81_15515 [Longimicrobium sp.]|nr:hypothetical protein [Longimicrobium sp.]
MAIYRLRFFFDAGSGVCLWADNHEARESFGDAVRSDDLPLEPSTEARLERLIAWYDESIDWDDPGTAWPWTDEEQARFDAETQAVLALLRQELGAEYEIEDRSKTLKK